MNQKILNILVPVFFAALLSIVVFQKFQQAELHADFSNIQLEQISNAHFYKDYIRDSEELYLAIETQYLPGFMECIRAFKSTNTSIKNLTVERDAKIKFLFNKKQLVFHVIQVEEFSDILFVSADWIDGDFLINAGLYTSTHLISWLEDITSSPAYASIWEY